MTEKQFELVDQKGKRIMIKNISPPVVRETEYYKCSLVICQDKSKHTNHQLYKFVGLCNPYISLLDTYTTLALPTTNFINKQLVKFIVKCIREYQRYKSTQLIKQFFDGKASPHHSEIQKIITEYSQLQQNQLKGIDEKYPTISYQSLSAQMKRLIDEQYFNNFLNRMKKNLDKLQIIPRANKLQRIRNLALSLHGQLGSQIYWNRKKTQIYLLTKGSYLEMQQDRIPIIRSLEQMLFVSQNFQISLQELYEISRYLLRQLEEFHMQLLQHYKKSVQQWRVSKSEAQKKLYYDLAFNNIILNLVKKNQNQIVINQGYDCHLDYMVPFIYELGLQQLPSSIENIALFHSTPHPGLLEKRMEEVLQKQIQKQTSASNIKIRQIQTIVKWFLIFEYCHVKLLHLPRIALIEALTNIEQILFEIKSINQSLICDKMKLILQLYSNQFTNENPSQNNLKLSSLNFKEMRQIIAEPTQEQKEQGKKQKYLIFKLITEAYFRLFFNPENIKQFLEKNKFIARIINTAKYMYIFLLGKYIQLSIQKFILDIYQDQTQDIRRQPQYQMIEPIEKLQGVFRIVRKKFDEYRLRKQSDGCRRYFFQNQTQEERSLFEEIKDTNFGHYYFNFGQQDRREISRSDAVADKIGKLKQILLKIQRLAKNFFQMIMQQIQHTKNEQIGKMQQYNNNYAKAQKCKLCLLAFFRLDRSNLSDVLIFQQQLGKLFAANMYQSKEQIKVVYNERYKYLEEKIDRKESFFDFI